ncbi:complex I subunit 5 family protein [Streptomyces sp. WAC06614]|uniref:complex I subunit 5 family protein n=1 Tax=Streptomyces sp. WAC06614 TaxID=2487416 RepID=UPI000F780527|nr:complex I subunit 5 family protein [Streptomyces sp. WAC06614]RSS78745.1 NADH dehydrogenase [Streptomyces sp. WAC06614]
MRLPGAEALLPLAVVVPLVGAAVLAVVGRWLPRLGCDVVATATAALDLGCLVALWPAAADRATARPGGWPAQIGIVLAVDPVGAGLALLCSALVLAVLVYSWRYFDEPAGERQGLFPALLLVFEAGMVGFVVTADLFDAFVFFELMGVAAYALTGYRIEDPRPLQGALTFGMVNSVAAYCTLLGIGMLYARTGELNLARIGERLGQRPVDVLVVAGFVLVATALLVKAAAAPFHFWLPDAHAVAPTPVCMLMSGAMVELGVYGLARIYWSVFSGPGGVPPEVFRSTFVALGAVTALLGALMCWQQRHLKRMLAFSTVSHVGLFLICVALLTPAATAAGALYVAGHGCAKAALFGLTGVLLDQYGSVDEHGLRGRGRGHRFVGVLFVLGGLLLAGLPPAGTGLGKALAEAESEPAVAAVFVLASAVTGATVLRAAGRIFWAAGRKPAQGPRDTGTTGEGEEPEVRARARRAPRPMVVVPALLLGVCVLLGVLPGVGEALGHGAELFTDRQGYAAAVAGSPVAGHHPGAVPGPETGWHADAFGPALGTVVLACLLAGAALFGRAPARVRRAATGAVRPVRRLHSGLLGDYVAWLTAGVAALLIAVAAQTLGP